MEKKWTEYSLETPEDVETSAFNISVFMDNDRTEPTGGDRNRWLSDVKLRELESKLVQGEMKFGLFAKLCHQAMAKTVEPHGRALLLLGVLNGERRKLADRNDEVVNDLIRRSAEAISALPAGARKDRLDGLLDYHMGIYARVVGDYYMAAELQRKSAEKAEKAGDIKGMAISAFCEAVERVSATLADDGHNGFVLDWRIDVMEAAAEMLGGVLEEADDPTSKRWRMLNCPVHRIMVFFWDDRWALDEDRECLSLVEEYVSSDPANSAHKPLALLCRAIESNVPSSVEDVWNGKVDGELHPEHKATAGLWLARNSHDDDEIIAYYEAVIKMDGPIHVVRAIAARELALFKKMKGADISAVTDDGSKL